MTVQEIKNYALLLCGQRDIPDAYLLQYINESMDNLTVKYDSAGQKKILVVSGIKGEWQDLPNDCVTLKRCNENGSEFIYDNFYVENGQIQFGNTAEYKIEYIALQEHVTALTDTPNINIAYHECLAYGVAFKEATRIFMYEDMVEGNQKFILLQEFNKKAIEANNKVSNSKRSRKRIKYADFF